MISFEDYCNKFEHKIIGELMDEIYHFDIPRIVVNELMGTIENYTSEIMLDRYEGSISDFEDEQYDRYKEEQLL